MQRTKDLEKTIFGQASRSMSVPAHTLSCEVLAAETNANITNGLTAGEARSRLEAHGPNELGDGPGVQPVRILVRQIANAMMLVRTPLKCSGKDFLLITCNRYCYSP